MTIEDILLHRFPGDSGRTLIFRNHLAHVCNEFIKSGLADRKFTTELLSGSDSKFWACISEALVASHLMKAGLNLEPTHGAGPDFLIVENGRKIWIEVTCPQAAGVPSYWGEINVNEVVDFPHKEILLRWTAAIKEKSEKLIGSRSGSVNGYIEKGIVGPEDAYVIAVNGCQLRHGSGQSVQSGRSISMEHPSSEMMIQWPWYTTRTLSYRYHPASCQHTMSM